jgi:hypothetical protein
MFVFGLKLSSVGLAAVVGMAGGVGRITPVEQFDDVDEVDDADEVVVAVVVVVDSLFTPVVGLVCDEEDSSEVDSSCLLFV